MPRCFILAVMLLATTACSGSRPEVTPPPPTPRGTYDPTSGCQQALAHVVTLSLEATGAGPNDAQREAFLRRCVATRSERGSACVLQLKRMPGRRGGAVNLAPALGCLGGS